MQQDFKGKKNNTSKRNTARPVFAIIAAALVVVLIGFFYVRYRINSPHGSGAKSIVSSTPLKKSNRHHVKKNNAGGRFDFYSLLSKMSVKQQGSVDSTSTQAAQKSYFLQVASIRRPNGAVALRDKLGALGMTTTVLKVSNNSGWYRVLAGSYASVAEARQDQQRLKQQHIDSLLITQ